MIVIKLGGSLVTSHKVIACLDKIEQHYQQHKVVIVPGGGQFADQVRLAQHTWYFSDKTAHHMAILAMQQMALLFNAIKPVFKLCPNLALLKNQSNAGIYIWSPDIFELDKANIPASWDVSSDSLSAWLALCLDAKELIVVKSDKIPNVLDVPSLIKHQIVDASFYNFTKSATFALNIVQAEDFLLKT